MNPAIETTDLETLFKIALTDDSIETRRRARSKVLDQSFDLGKVNDPAFLDFLGETIKNPSATIRRRAAEILCFVPDLDDSLLHSVASDKSWIVRDAFWKSLLTKLDQTPEIETQWLGSAAKAAIKCSMVATNKSLGSPMIVHNSVAPTKSCRALISTLRPSPEVRTKTIPVFAGAGSKVIDTAWLP